MLWRRLLPPNTQCDCKAHESYKELAIRTSGWLLNSTMRNPANLYNDGVRPSPTDNNTCPNDNGPLWSYMYCQGLPIGFDVELHRLTGDSKYLDDALALVDGIRSTLVAPATWPSDSDDPSSTDSRESGMVLYENECQSDPMCAWVYPPLPSACKCDNNAMIFKGIASTYSGEYIYTELNSHFPPDFGSELCIMLFPE